MRRKNKNIIIGMLCCMLVFMGVGYAVFQQALNIVSTGSISSKWNIKITNVTEEAKDGYISDVVMNHDDLNANVSAVFQAPGDWIEFRIRVENQGTIDAILEEVKLTKNDNGDKEYIDVKISGIEAKEALNREESKEFIVRMEFDPNVTELPNQEEDYKITATIGLKYVQKGSTTGSGSGSESTVCYNTNDDGSVRYNYACGTEVAVPATTEDGTPITTLTQSMFAVSNVTQIYDYDEENDEEIIVLAITDEDNYDEIKTSLDGLVSDMSTSATLGKEITLTPLNVIEKIGTVIEISGSGSGSGGSTAVYIVCRYSEVASLGLSENAEYYPGYYDIETQEFMEASSRLTKLDLSQATNLTTIGEYAFAYSPLETIIFGDNSNITTIGEGAFQESGLTALKLPSALTTIGDYAFDECGMDGKLIIPNSVTKIGASAFRNNNVISLTFEEGSRLNSIANSVFANNKISGELIIPNSITEIGYGAFSNNDISALNFQEGSVLTSIGYSAFSNNNISGKLILPSSITKLNNGYEFSNNLISEIVFPNTFTEIGYSTFSNNQILGVVILPAHITTIGDNAFSGNQISKLTIPSSVENVGSSAFNNNVISTLVIERCNKNVCSKNYNKYGSGVEALMINGGEIPSNAFNNYGILNLSLKDVTTIGASAFSGNSISGELVIPASVTTIGVSAFSGNQISKLTIPSSVENVGSSAFNNNVISTLVIERCNKNVCSSINVKYGSSIETLAISGGEIPSNAFNNYGILNLSLKDVTTIGDSAFSGNSISGELVIPASVTTIGVSAFSGNQISKLTIPSSVENVGSSAFNNNDLSALVIEQCNENICSNVSDKYGSSIETLTINGGEIPSNAFNNYGILNLSLKDVTTIGDSAFSGNSISGELVIPASVTSIGGYAFYGGSTNMISKLTFEEGSKLETIGTAAFMYNKISGELVIPASVKTLLDSAFFDNQISKLTFEKESKLQTIGESVFESNQISGELVIPTSVTTIGANAFKNNKIDSLTFEEGSKLQIIDVYAFGINNLTGDLTLPASVTTIGDYAFSGNNFSILNLGSKLTSIGRSAFYVLVTINIDMTKSEFANVSKGTAWYGNGYPTIKYKEG